MASPLAVLFALALSDAAGDVEPAPKSLLGRSFFVETDLQGLPDSFDPDTPPRGAVFTELGVALYLRRDEQVCALNQVGGDAHDGLVIDCNNGFVYGRTGHWHWIDAHRARTDLLSDCPVIYEKVVEVDHPPNRKELLARFVERFEASALPALAGRFKEAGGGELVVGTDGRVTVDGTSRPFVVRRCDLLGPHADPPAGPPECRERFHAIPMGGFRKASAAGFDDPPGHGTCLVPTNVALDGGPAYLLDMHHDPPRLREGEVGGEPGYYPFEVADHERVFIRE